MRVIFRIWIDGELRVREEHESDQVNLSELQARHQRVVEEATATDDKPWLIEIEAPELPADERYLRFGTDRKGMDDPSPMGALVDHPWAKSSGIDP